MKTRRKVKRPYARQADSSTVLAYNTISAALYTLARDSAIRSTRNPEEALATIILAAMWLEGVCKSGDHRNGHSRKDNAAKIATLEEAVNKVGRNYLNLIKKAAVIFRAFRHKYSSSSPLFRRVALLYELRNKLGHMRPPAMRGFPQKRRRIYFDESEIVRQLRKEGLHPPQGPSAKIRQVVWTDVLLRKETADWAIRSAQAMAVEIAESFPAGRLRYEAHRQNPARPEFDL